MASEIILPDGIIRSINPATLEILGEVCMTPPEKIPGLVSRARRAQRSWSRMSVSQRLAYISSFRRVLLDNRHEVARQITREVGKPRMEAFSGDIFGALETCAHAEKHTARLLAPQTITTNALFFPGKRSYNLLQAPGVVAIIAPWNYPLSIPVGSMVQALAFGNAVILKTSPKAPLIGKEIERLFMQAGFPEGLVTVITGDRDQATALVQSDVDHIIFTGSGAGGRAIMSLAAEKLHTPTLELGGKHAAIVLEDAQLEKIYESIVWCAFTNCGQACASIERLYVVRSIADKFIRLIEMATNRLRVDDGSKVTTDVGPLIDAQSVARVASQVEQAVAAGAELIAGGSARPDLGGYFFEPTVLLGVNASIRVAQEEIFGPVLPITIVDSEEEALELTNNSPYGLGNSVWTADLARGERLAHQIQSGLVWVNDGIYSHACPGTSWGGWKESGIGQVHAAVRQPEGTVVKHIGIDKAGARDWQYPYSQDRLDLIDNGLVFLHSDSPLERLKVLPKLSASWWHTRRF